MNQAERDWLVALKKAKKKLITQKEAALELGVTERHVRRLLKSMKKRGDKAVIHALRGQKSNRRIDEKIRQEATKILSQEVYRGFGPTLASEYLAKKHKVNVSRETVRTWMIEAKLWRPKKERVGKVHQWRARRSRFGDLLQWDTSDHDWLEGRGDELKLILLIDDASSKWHARFVRNDSTEENMEVLERYLKKWGRPLSCYTDKASLFQTAVKTKRDEQRQKDRLEMPPTQIGRALRELGITWIAAHSPQAKGRVERNFGTAQDRLVKGMRVAGVTTIEQANQYLTNDYLVWWERELTVAAANPDDAHRRLEEGHNLAASLSHVETRQVRPDYTLRWDGKLYQIERQAVTTGLRGANLRVEQRLDGSLAVRQGERYLPVTECAPADRPKAARPKNKPATTRRAGRRGSDWNKDFDLKKAPKLWQAVQASGHRQREVL